MGKRLLILFIAVCFFCFSPTLAQETTTLTYYTTENGLPSNGIKGLQWDDNAGFLWVATEAGLLRYNGVAFKLFRSDDGEYANNERVLFLVKNSANDIFVGDIFGNIFIVKKNKPLFYERYPWGDVSASRLYGLPVSNELYRLRKTISIPENFHILFHKVLPIGDTACLIVTRKNAYYTSSSHENVERIPINFKPLTGFKIDNKKFLVDEDHNVFLLHSDRKTLTPISVYHKGVLLKKRYSEFHWYSGVSETVLLNCGSAYTLSMNGNHIEAKFIFDKIPDNIDIRQLLYIEKLNTLILGTNSKGLIVLTKSNIESLNTLNPGINKKNAYYSQIEIDKEIVLTNEGHIISKKPSNAIVAPIKNVFSNFVYNDGDTSFWFVDINDKLNYLSLFPNGKVKKKKWYPKTSLNIQTAITKTNGTIYIANDRMIGKLVGDSIQTVYTYSLDNKQKSIYDLKEIKPGVLALANCNSVLQYRIGDNHLDTLFNGGNSCVRSIWKYKEYFFIGTYGSGFFILKNGIIKKMPIDKNKYLLFAHCFVQDDFGYCWISTNRGLFKARLSDITEAFEKNTPYIYYHYYGKNDGMLTTEMNGGCIPCGIVLRNKVISFPTMEGLLWINPAANKPPPAKPILLIDYVRVNKKRMSPDSIFQTPFPSNTDEIEVEVAYPAWEKKENIYIEYKLDNATQWEPLTDIDMASIKLTRLATGRHQLNIRKVNGFGVNNYILQTISFSINLKWYQRWWFFLLCVAVALWIIYLTTALRTRQYKARQKKLEILVEAKTKELKEKNVVLEKNDTLKTRLISIISHDLVAPLKFLSMAGKNLISKREIMSPVMQEETLYEIAHTSEELQLLSTNILNWIKYQNKNRRQIKEPVEIFEIAREVLGLLQNVANQKKVLIINNTQRGLLVNQYYEPIKVIIYNIVTNAINFTDAGTIEISTEQKEKKIIISVTDTGIGMTNEQMQNLNSNEIIISSANTDNRKGHGLGYLIIKDLLNITQASISFSSEKGVGTTVSIHIPERDMLQNNPI